MAKDNSLTTISRLSALQGICIKRIPCQSKKYATHINDLEDIFTNKAINAFYLRYYRKYHWIMNKYLLLFILPFSFVMVGYTIMKTMLCLHRSWNFLVELKVTLTKATRRF